MHSTIPNFENGACPRCHRKPCYALAQSLGASIVLASNGNIPAACPLKIPPSSLSRYSQELRRFSLRQALSVSSSSGSNSLPSGISATTPPGDVIRSLHSQGRLAILAAPHGSPARKQLDAWRGAKLAGARKAQEAKAAEEAAELEREKPKPALMAPAWVWLADPKKPECEEKAVTEGALYDSVWCKVDTEGLMPGDSVTFSIYLACTGGAEDAKLTTVMGRVGEGRSDEAAVGAWKFEAEVGGKSIVVDKDDLYFVARRQLDNLEVTSAKIKVGPQKGECAEVHDALFCHNSALMALSSEGDEDAFGALNILAEALIYATDHTDRETLIYGHADTTGDAGYNVEISKLRAQGVKALLDGNRDEWVSVAMKKGSTESLEKYLQAFHKAFAWDCDPGDAVSPDAGSGGEDISTAIENFQAAINAEHEGNLEVDGKMGRNTWGAIFHLLYEQLGLLVEAKGQDPKKVKMRYASHGGGIVACGEKFPIDAKEKDGFRSQKNRRVEIAFVEKARPVPRTRRYIYLDPILIRADKGAAQEKKSGITGIEMWCRHSEIEDDLEKDSIEAQEKADHQTKTPKPKRTARQNQILEVVPDILRGDEITLNSVFASEKDKVEWTVKGWSEEQKAGDQVKIKVRGFREPIEKILPVDGVWASNFNPHIVNVSARDSTGKEIQGVIHAYPKISDKYELDFSEKLKAIKKITEKFHEVAHFLGREIEFEYLKGKVSLQGGFKEDEDSRKAFFGFDITAGFSPLFGGSMKFPIPINGILEIIPKSIREYAAQIGADFDLAGELNFNCHFIRTGVEIYRSTGGLSGAIKMGISLNAHIGKKLLELEAGAMAEIAANAPLFIEAEDNFKKWKVGFEMEIGFEGLKGEITWKILHGTWVKQKSITFIDAQEIMKSRPYYFIS